MRVLNPAPYRIDLRYANFEFHCPIKNVVKPFCLFKSHSAPYVEGKIVPDKNIGLFRIKKTNFCSRRRNKR